MMLILLNFGAKLKLIILIRLCPKSNKSKGPVLFCALRKKVRLDSFAMIAKTINYLVNNRVKWSGLILCV
jgi:hypothetical protein